MNGIDCTILRGGSSKGIYIERDALPPPGKERDRRILDLFGSPDVRQIDGLGGAGKLTSKVAVMGKPTRSDGKSERGKPYSVRIGHPGGHLEVRAKLDPISNRPPTLESAIIGRTARVIMDGCAYLKA